MNASGQPGLGSQGDPSPRDVERRLQESEQRLMLAQHAGHVGVFDWDMCNHHIFATPEAEILYGLPPGRQNYTFADFLALLHPEDRPQLESEIAAAVGEARPEMTAEFRIIRPDGTVRFLLQRAIITYDDDRHPLRMVGTSLDNTERRRAEEILRQSEEKFSRVFHLCPDPISLNRADDGTYLDINEGFERITGWTRADVVGRSSMSHSLGIWVHDSDRERLVKMVREQGQVIDFEAAYRRKDGAIITGLMSSRVIEINGEKCLMSVTRDITQRKAMEAELAHQNAVSSALFNSTGDPIFSLDRDLRYTLFNASHARAMKLLGGVDIAPGFCTLDGLRRPEDRQLAKEQLDRALAGQRVEFDFPAANGHGERRDYRMILSPVRAADGEITGVAVFGHDLTDMRRLHSQLLQAQKMEAIGLLAGGIAHDFRNQLTVILAAAELLKEDPQLPSRAAEFLDQILDAARQSSDMTSKLLSFSRKQMLQPRLVDLAETVEETARILPRLLRPDIRLEFTAESRPLQALLDPVQLQQAILNLATNARDAMPAGGSLRIVCRRIVPDEGFRQEHPDAAASYVAVIVSDSGHGMDPQTLQHIFEPFFTTKPVGKGTGLGLAMVYGFVQQCAGVVDVQSAPGAGTTFRLLFREAQQRPETPPPTPAAPPPSQRGRVLVVEDDEAIRHLLGRFLSAAGFEAQECSCVNEALPFLQDPSLPFDLLLSDIAMPGLSGIELAKRAATLRPGLPVLLVSGYTDSVELRQGVTKHFLAKPFTRQTLLRAVEEALQSAPASGA